MFTPDSDVYLLNVPITQDSPHQVDFDSISEQSSYFMSRAIQKNFDFTYQRKDNMIRVPFHIDSLWNCNYVMYQNTNFTNKWFYAFVTKMEYASQNCTHVYIKTDVFQTWLFNHSLRSSLVLREHVSDDSRYKHTLPDYFIDSDYTAYISDSILPNDWGFSASNAADAENNYYALFIMSDYIEGWTMGSAMFVSGAMQPAIFLVCELSDMWEVVNAINEDGKASAVCYTGMIPKAIANRYQLNPTEQVGWFLQGSNDDAYGTWATFNDWGGALDGYTPKNNKLYCYPYNYIMLSNNDGQIVNLKCENFHDTSYLQFNIYCTIGADTQVCVAPVGYCKTGVNFDYAITIANFPETAFITDSYANYVALNKNALIFNMVTSALNSAAAVASGNVAGVTPIASQAVSDADAQNKPDAIKGHLSGNMQVYSGACDITFNRVCLRAELLEAIDKYFDRYGYFVNELKTPDLKSRPAWNYIKTQNCCIVGDCPQSDINELKAMYDNGLTIWHSPYNVGNYYQNNRP